MSELADEVADSPEETPNPAPRTLDAPNHNRYTWRRGCRCGVCRADHRLDLRERRAAKKQKRHDDQAAAERREKHYPTMVAVAKQLDSLKAMEANPGIAAIALKMAAILDDSTATPQQPAAAGKLLEALRELGVRPQQASNQLATVRDMVNRPVAVPNAAAS